MLIFTPKFRAIAFLFSLFTIELFVFGMKLKFKYMWLMRRFYSSRMRALSFSTFFNKLQNIQGLKKEP